MADVTITNEQLLVARIDLRSASSTNGSTSVKLHRIRQQLEAEAEPVIATWAEIDKRYAWLDGDRYVFRKGEDESPQNWLITGTMAYVADPTKVDKRAEEMQSLNADEVELRVPLLSEADLERVVCVKDIGASLDLFTEP